MDEIVRRKFGPPDDTAMLPWYQGAYSNCFIALHPFFTVEGLDPALCEHGTCILTSLDRPRNSDFLTWAAQRLGERQIGKEISGASILDVAKRFGRRVSWKSICACAGFSNHCDLNRALLTYISALKEDYQDLNGAKRLADYCGRERIFLPTEGTFQPLMEDVFVSLLESKGINNVIAGDEFGKEERLVDLSTLRSAASWSNCSKFIPSTVMRRLFTPDHSFFAWIHWDSFFTAVFTNDFLADKDAHPAGLEGFWCSKETSVSWTTQTCIPLAE